MEIGLNQNEYISLLLSVKVINVDLRNKIIEEKDKLEKKEAYEYHVERWKEISIKYFRSFRKDKYNNKIYYSYVLNDTDEYNAEVDDNLDYYNETGVSYQVRDLLLSTIISPGFNPDRSLLNYKIKEWRKLDDTMYGILAKKIMKKMKR